MYKKIALMVHSYISLHSFYEKFGTTIVVESADAFSQLKKKTHFTTKE